MIHFLTIKSIKNRKLTSFLSILSIAISITLFIGIDRVRNTARDGFTNTISKADLLVGAKGSPLQLLMYTVFHLGSAVNNIRYSSFEELRNNRAVKWVIPISLGDSYKGHRVVGTSQSFFDNYRFRGDSKVEFLKGKFTDTIWGVVVGSKAADKFKLKIGDAVTLSHGIQEDSILVHENSPFKITGILKQTSTPIDKAFFVSLYGIEAMHVGWESGVPDEEGVAKQTSLKKEDLKINQLTSIILGARNRIFTLRLRSMIDRFENEPLMAVIPGLALQELWQTLSYVEDILYLISLSVLLVGIVGIVIALYTSINERRRELAILRSQGMGYSQLMSLLVYESGILVALGSILGMGILYILLFFLKPYLEKNFSVYLPLEAPPAREWIYLGGVILIGFVAGIIPAIKAFRNSLKDGLTIRV